MEFNENGNLPDDEEDYAEIYSRKAIFWFALFSPLYASILFIINLWSAGFKSVIYQIVLFFLLFTFAEFLAGQKMAQALGVDPNKPLMDIRLLYINLVSVALNVLFAFILSRFFYKKYFPDNDYYPRDIQTPLFMFLGFILFSLFVVGYSI